MEARRGEPARRPDVKDVGVEDDLVDVDSEIRDAVDVRGDDDVGAEDETVLAAATGKDVVVVGAIEPIRRESADESILAEAAIDRA